METTGPVYWIDHFVLNSADVPRWEAFNEAVLGATFHGPAPRGVFQKVGAGTIGAFRAEKPLPPSAGVARGLPRYGYFIDQRDIDAHVRRLQAHGVAYDGPHRTTAEGEAGIALAWEDPDGNQFEFWAPDALPAGAMAEATPVGVGRISHATFESRDLERTADFFARYCDLKPVRSADIPAGTLVLPLAGGARLIYKEVTALGGRTTGMGLADAHTALCVHDDSFFPNYRRLWAGVAEWGEDSTACGPGQSRETLPARTARHGSKEGRQFYALVNKGDDFFDWDTNQFHFIGGAPKNGSMAEYEAHIVGVYIAAWEREHGNLDGFGAMAVEGDPP
ncbi:MAG TPA: VOC family protein [Candidatus Lustribacter sp.]|nr:VOC family protein [Candidatus Lustribacter sp.]